MRNANLDNSILWSNYEIELALENQIISFQKQDELLINKIVIDSRKISKNNLFIALKGDNTDGHNYLNQAFESGASYAIVDNIPHNLKSEYKNKLIIVKNTYQSLYKLAKYARDRFKGKVIGLTGSVGKTTTKDILGKTFATQGKTHISFGNFNNHIGLPLCLANLPYDADYGIFEMGMNHANEILPLSKLARPHIAIITNVGPVHIEFFNNEQEIALAKSEIFSGIENSGYAIINADNPHFNFLYEQAKLNNISTNHIVSFGFHDNADFQLITTNQVNDDNNLEIEAFIKKTSQKIKYRIGSTNHIHAINSIIALACLNIIGKNLNEGLRALVDFENSDGRGKIHQINYHEKSITIIDDTYNASILSMKAGIENCLNYQKIIKPNRLVCALGDMRELGEKSLEIHNELLTYLSLKKFDLVILVGEQMELANRQIKLPNSINFVNSELAQPYFESNIQNNDLIYIKGSRGVKMEKLFENIIIKNSAK